MVFGRVQRICVTLVVWDGAESTRTLSATATPVVGWR